MLRLMLFLLVSSVWAKAPRKFVDFAFENLKSVVVESDQIRKGKVLLFKIGQLSCPVCSVVLGHMGKLDQEYQAKGAVFLDISLDDDATALANHAKDYGVDFETLMDKENDLANYFGISMLPVTVLVSRQGDILEYVVGELSEVDLRNMLDSALRQP